MAIGYWLLLEETKTTGGLARALNIKEGITEMGKGSGLWHLHYLVENLFEAEQINDSVRTGSKSHLHTGHNI